GTLRDRFDARACRGGRRLVARAERSRRGDGGGVLAPRCGGRPPATAGRGAGRRVAQPLITQAPGRQIMSTAIVSTMSVRNIPTRWSLFVSAAISGGGPVAPSGGGPGGIFESALTSLRLAGAWTRREKSSATTYSPIPIS